MSSQYLTVKQLCDRWGKCRKTLWKQRKNDTGPIYKKIGGEIRYMLVDVLAYEQQSGIGTDNNVIDIDFSDLKWLQYSTLNISNNLLYLVLYALVYTMKTKSFGNTEYLAFKQLAILFRDRLTASIPSMRTALKKITNDL
jgi:hypothetical protein